MGDVAQGMSVQFRLLGPLAVTAGGAPVGLSSRKQRELLTLLLLNAGRVLSTDFIIDELWGEDPPGGGVKTLRYHVSELRRVVRDSSGLELPLETMPNGYVLALEPTSVDSLQFESMLEEAKALRSHDPARSKEMLDDALGLWRGRPLAGEEEFLGFAQGEIRRLEALRLGAQIERCELMIALGEHDATIPELERLVGDHATNERLHGLLMLALYRAGRQSDALATYRALHHRLVEEKGIDPSPELRKLEERILSQDPELSAAAANWAIPTVRHLPAGTVTFLFTDIEGSTQRWSTDPDGMRAVLEAHDAALVESVTAHHGVVFKHTGDGVGAVFVNPHDAIDAAVDAQLALAANPAKPQVRIAIHSGLAEPAGDDYFGLTVSKCARVAGVGHGGQILLSSAAAGLVEATEPVELRSLGLHRLRDIRQPEQLYQVVHPQLRAEFPALMSLEHPHSNLPAHLTEIVGRTGDLAELDELLAAHRVVTLLGAGGVGKTRLALEAAARRRFATRDGVRLVELAAADAETVTAAVAHGLGVQPRAGLSMEESLVDWLRPRELVLVLDNCEHVVDAAARLVGLIAATGRDIVVLATSRQPLGITGEVSYQVQPLGTPPAGATPAALEASPAAALFVERATAARHGFRVDAANAPAIAEICRRLDGVPLAIELAAARVATLGVAEVAANLDTRTRLLTTTGGEPRHRSLAVAVGWSYDLLGPHEQLMFDRLSVSPSWLSLDSAVAVVGDLTGGVEVVSALVERSMLVVVEDEAGTWFRMLEPLRDFGLARLAARAEVASSSERHARHFATVAAAGGEGIRTADEPAWARRLERTFPNVRAAFRWATEAGDVDLAAGLVDGLWSYALQRLRSEPFDWAAHLAGSDSIAGHSLAPQVIGAAAVGAWLRGELAGAVRYIEAALAAEKQLGTGPTIPARLALIDTAGYAADLGPDDRAAVLGALPERFIELVEACRATGDPYWMVHSLVTGSFGRSLARDLPGAIKLAGKAVDVATESGNPTSLAWAQYATGSILAGHDPQAAERAAAASAQAARAVGSRLVEGLAVALLATIRRRSNRPAEAAPLLLDLLDHWEQAGNRAQLWHTLRETALTLSTTSDGRSAAALLGAVAAAPLVMPHLPYDEDDLAATVADLQERLGAGAALGRSLSREDAVELARTELASLIATRS